MNSMSNKKSRKIHPTLWAEVLLSSHPNQSKPKKKIRILYEKLWLESINQKMWLCHKKCVQMKYSFCQKMSYYFSRYSCCCCIVCHICAYIFSLPTLKRMEYFVSRLFFIEMKTFNCLSLSYDMFSSYMYIINAISISFTTI